MKTIKRLERLLALIVLKMYCHQRKLFDASTFYLIAQNEDIQIQLPYTILKIIFENRFLTVSKYAIRIYLDLTNNDNSNNCVPS